MSPKYPGIQKILIIAKVVNYQRLLSLLLDEGFTVDDIFIALTYDEGRDLLQLVQNTDLKGCLAFVDRELEQNNAALYGIYRDEYGNNGRIPFVSLVNKDEAPIGNLVLKNLCQEDLALVLDIANRALIDLEAQRELQQPSELSMEFVTV